VKTKKHKQIDSKEIRCKEDDDSSGRRPDLPDSVAPTRWSDDECAVTLRKGPEGQKGQGRTTYLVSTNWLVKRKKDVFGKIRSIVCFKQDDASSWIRQSTKGLRL
jgi:hypothetical protein